MSYTLSYHPDVLLDLKRIPNPAKTRIRQAIESRLTTMPQSHARPLRGTLKGYWRLRVGDYRVVFLVKGNEVIILGVIHRKDVYTLIWQRVN